MSEFDPYHKWLGISKTARSVSKYRLLGIDDFEDDTDVITAASDRQAIYLKTLQAGEHSELVAQLLNEVAQARVTLLNAFQKSVYDEQLSKHQTSGSEPAPATTPILRTPPPLPGVPSSTLVDESEPVTQPVAGSAVQSTNKPRHSPLSDDIVMGFLEDSFEDGLPLDAEDDLLEVENNPWASELEQQNQESSPLEPEPPQPPDDAEKVVDGMLSRNAGAWRHVEAFIPHDKVPDVLRGSQLPVVSMDNLPPRAETQLVEGELVHPLLRGIGKTETPPPKCALQRVWPMESRKVQNWIMITSNRIVCEIQIEVNAKNQGNEINESYVKEFEFYVAHISDVVSVKAEVVYSRIRRGAGCAGSRDATDERYVLVVNLTNGHFSCFVSNLNDILNVQRTIVRLKKGDSGQTVES